MMDDKTIDEDIELQESPWKHPAWGWAVGTVSKVERMNDDRGED